MDIARSLRPLAGALGLALAGAAGAEDPAPASAAPPAAVPAPAAAVPALSTPAPAPVLAPTPARSAAGPEDEGRDRVKTISGKVAQIDRAKPELVVETPEGPLALSFDRNTTVWLDRHVGTLRDLDVGTPVRAGYDVARKRAQWVEVRKLSVEPPPVTAQAQPAGPSLPPPPGSATDVGAPDVKGSGEREGSDRAPPSTLPPQPPSPGGMPPLSPGPGGASPVLPPR
jgi:hypothetical protein